MAKWFQHILPYEEEAKKNYIQERSLRAYELFKKNKYKQPSDNKGDSSTNKQK